MTKLHRVVVYHPSTDNYWYSKFEECEDVEVIKDIIRSICESSDYFKFDDENGDSVFFPKNLIQECVFKIEESKA